MHAMSRVYGLAGLQLVGLVKTTLEDLRRILSKPNSRKEPVIANMFVCVYVCVCVCVCVCGW